MAVFTLGGRFETAALTCSLCVCLMRAAAYAHADLEARDQDGRRRGAKPGLRPLISGGLSSSVMSTADIPIPGCLPTPGMPGGTIARRRCRCDLGWRRRGLLRAGARTYSEEDMSVRATSETHWSCTARESRVRPSPHRHPRTHIHQGRRRADTQTALSSDRRGECPRSVTRRSS